MKDIGQLHNFIYNFQKLWLLETRYFIYNFFVFRYLKFAAGVHDAFTRQQVAHSKWISAVLARLLPASNLAKCQALSWLVDMD